MPDGYDPTTGQSSGFRETQAQRVNRELIELLNELRVALPGVQVLFAFLLAVPFTRGFSDTTDFQRDLFFAVLLATAISTALLIAPTAYHRINFRTPEKERMLITANRLSLGGLVFLALAIIGAVVLVADFVYGPSVPIISGALGVALFAGLWLVLPLMRHGPQRELGE